MSRSCAIHRVLPLGATIVALLLRAPSGMAADRSNARAAVKPPSVCSASVKSAQDLEQQGRLREAREQLGKCAMPTCGVLEKKCVAEAARLDGEVPQISPVITDEAEAPVVDVTVRIDGLVVASRLDGRPIRVDPGVHEFILSGPKPDEPVLARRRILIVQGQRGPLPFSRRPADPPKPAPEAQAPPVRPPSPAPTPASTPTAEATFDASAQKDRPTGGPSAFPYILGGVGLLSLGAGALLTYWGNRDNDMLAQCSPRCAPASVNHIRNLYIGADVSFGVGAVSLAVATVLFATRSSERLPSQSAYRMDVRPTTSGAFTTVSGAF